MNYIQENIIHEMEIKKSKFITYLFFVDSEEEAKEHLVNIKKQHPKANHHCSAMVIDEIVRSNDDGEPASTAGLPMLQTLQGEGMNHILAIVVRYFGGIKLGKGGLIRAYGHSVSEALKQTDYYVEELISIYKIITPFDQMNIIETKSEPKAKIMDRQYNQLATFTLEVYNTSILEELVELSSGKIDISHQEDIKRLIKKH